MYAIRSYYVHVKSFRYGKDPSVIRCNRGDSLLLTFSSDDTGHSFFLEEFDMDVKVNPATSQVSVFKTSDPTQTPHLTDTVKIKAEHKGFWNYLISKSNFRCHVWCRITSYNVCYTKLLRVPLNHTTISRAAMT